MSHLVADLVEALRRGDADAQVLAARAIHADGPARIVDAHQRGVEDPLSVAHAVLVAAGDAWVADARQAADAEHMGVVGAMADLRARLPDVAAIRARVAVAMGERMRELEDALEAEREAHECFEARTEASLARIAVGVHEDDDPDEAERIELLEEREWARDEGLLGVADEEDDS